jgi:hypothetical protein
MSKDKAMYETRDANFKNLLIIAGGLVLLVGMTMLVARGLLGFFEGYTAHPGQRPTPIATPGKLPPYPRIQANPPADLATMMHEEDSVLYSYGWVNKDSGLARIPIERAMKLLVKEGLPVRQQQPMKKEAYKK